MGLAMNKRHKLIVMYLLAAFFFAWQVRIHQNAPLSWLVPLVLFILMIVNSIWFTRFVSWLIFAGSFFCMLVILSAFTLRWRLEPDFSSTPFYKSFIMYALFVYVSLAQLKILGSGSSAPHTMEEGK